MLVLASASPRRKEILRNAGIAFAVQAADVDETALVGESARECAERLAREKALAVWRRRPGDFVLGADTIVVVDGRILGKPGDAVDAARMLRGLSGREHQVVTGVCLAGNNGPRGLKPNGSLDADAGLKADSSTVAQASQVARASHPFGGELEDVFVDVRSETTLVVMGALTEEDIRAYVATG